MCRLYYPSSGISHLRTECRNSVHPGQGNKPPMRLFLLSLGNTPTLFDRGPFHLLYHSLQPRKEVVSAGEDFRNKNCHAHSIHYEQYNEHAGYLVHVKLLCLITFAMRLHQIFGIEEYLVPSLKQTTAAELTDLFVERWLQARAFREENANGQKEHTFLRH